MKKGDLVRATWTDGLVLVGHYLKKEKGYIILIDKNKTRIVCDRNIKFEILNAS